MKSAANVRHQQSTLRESKRPQLPQEFELAVKFIRHLLTMIPMCVSVVLMSVTILRDNVARFINLFDTKNLCVLLGSLQCCTINFSVLVSGGADSLPRKGSLQNLSKKCTANLVHPFLNQNRRIALRDKKKYC